METYKPITQWNEDDRPREKLLLKGRQALSDAELLAILIGTGTKYRNQDGSWANLSAVDLGKSLMQQSQNNLLNLSRMTVGELTRISGIGEAKAISVIAAMELGARRKAARNEPVKISSSRNAWEVLAPHVEDLQIEQFWALFLNQANIVLKCQKISEGGIAGTVIDPGPLFKMAVLENARAIILCHNHPSGNLRPSEADLQITRKLIQAGTLLEIQVIDHLIITNQGYLSMADEGLISR